MLEKGYLTQGWALNARYAKRVSKQGRSYGGAFLGAPGAPYKKKSRMF